MGERGVHGDDGIDEDTVIGSRDRIGIMRQQGCSEVSACGEAHNTNSRIGRMPDGGTITQDTHSLQCIVKGDVLMPIGKTVLENCHDITARDKEIRYFDAFIAR